MYVLLAATLFVVLLVLVAWRVRELMRVPVSARSVTLPSVSADRYRPMLRLLSDEDLDFVSDDRALQKTLRTRRRELFRSYLRCLGRDYALLLAGVRSAMVQSGVDRPDLARALAKNRFYFMTTMYRVELSLALHGVGMGKVDISGLVNALEGLRAQVSTLAAAPSAA